MHTVSNRVWIDCIITSFACIICIIFTIKIPTWLAEPVCSNRGSKRAYAEYRTSDLTHTMLWNHAYSPLKKSTKHSMIIFFILMIIQWLWYKCVIYKRFARISLINSSISNRYAYKYRHFMWWHNQTDHTHTQNLILKRLSGLCSHLFC